MDDVTEGVASGVSNFTAVCWAVLLLEADLFVWIIVLHLIGAF